MTREEAIQKFEKQLTAAQAVLDGGFGTHPGENDHLYRERKEMAEIALQALREQESRENPTPLTFEELRVLSGQPVYIRKKSEPNVGTWGIISDVYQTWSKAQTRLRLWSHPREYCIGEEWEAYRYQPKKEA
jgi:hypothetical protein